ncbi:MAG: ArsR family transcriptional regulator [Euryarchaeota archaeon]|jgi:ArsR family transcriptional regulator|uniref:ArsR/SmtB family transcription factor n=1 Tax=Methanobacterium sp. MZD130B TaxID=3394378 RepID=UPI00175A7B4B|nr:ArsR family transcriptional regulator [Euryarchaeota archaeon]HHT18261.1 ArsR family transcriptional regulator [Methanobacterium sp.]
MDLELLLDVMGCKTRRNILDLLREEPRFVSQISRELEIGQKAIIEHLRAMEEAGLLSSKFQKIERGRPRKYYDISNDVEFQIFISQGTIRVKSPGHEFQELQMLEEQSRIGDDVSSELEELIRNYDEAKKHAEILLKQVNERKRALKIRSLNLPVMFAEEEPPK